MGKITTRKDGYQIITINRKIVYYHRYLAEKYLPNPNNLPVVNHKDGNPSNNNLDNLEWTTYKGNHEHAKENKLWGKNIIEKRKLSWEQADEIRKKYIPYTYSYKKLAEEYKVDHHTIWDLVNNKSYIKTKGGLLGLPV